MYPQTMPSQGCWTCCKAGWSPRWEGFRLSLPCRIPEGPGLFDRLIADDYSRAGIETLTLDRKMAALPDVRRL